MDIDCFPLQPFHVRDAARLALTPHQIRTATDAGLLVRVTRGVYRRVDVPDTLEVRAAAVALALPAHHVLVDRSAAWLHGVDCLTLTEQVSPPPLEDCALRGTARSRRGVLDGRTRDLGDGDVMMVGGVAVTTPLRTALDLGCQLRRREAFAAMCGLARAHGFTRAELLRELPRYRRRRGVIQCRQLAVHVDPRVESAREAWLLLEICDNELPTPVPQWWVEVDGIATYRLDFAWPEARVCVEYDGWEAHDRTEGQRAADRERRAWLEENGWTVVVVRRGDFTGEALLRWTRELRRGLTPTYSNRRWGGSMPQW